LEGIGVVQRSKYISAFKLLLKAVNKDFARYTTKDLERFLLSLSHYKPKTRKTRWYDIKKFFRYLKKEDLFNEISPPKAPKGMKLPEELLTEDEVNLMVSTASNLRDKAFISVLYESGCRIGELLSCNLRNVEFDKYGGVLIVDGKTGMRRVRLIRSVPLLANWVANHPLNKNLDAFLWIGERNSRRPFRHRTACLILEDIAKRAGIRKRIHPHLFRHSRATHLANKLTEQQLKIYFGWVGDSKMVSTYVHLSGRDVDEAILQLNGIKTSIIEQKIPFKTCNRCDTKNDETSLYCSKCGMILDEKTAIQQANTTPNNPQDTEFQTFLQEMYSEWKQTKMREITTV
jgi:integrase/recombinase XerD